MPQGSLLGIFLFFFLVNDLAGYLHSDDVLTYMNDTVIFYTSASSTDVIAVISQLLVITTGKLVIYFTTALLYFVSILSVRWVITELSFVIFFQV